MKSIAENLLLWEQRIEKRIQSGMKIEEWCEKNGLRKNQYYYWNRQIRRKQTSDEEMMFADITSTLLNDDTIKQVPILSPDFHIFFNNLQITVPSDFNPESLAGLMKVLQAL